MYSLTLCFAVVVEADEPTVGVEFSGQRVITSNTAGAASVYAADLDGDGYLDVLSASQGDDKIAWYQNREGRFFSGQNIIATSADGARAVHAADLDADGDMDVLSASLFDDKIAWYRNEGEDTFSAERVISTDADGASDVHAADLDGDGDMDVLAAADFDNEIVWYRNDGGGSFSAKRVITTFANGAASVHVADLDGDGDTDVLSASTFDDKIAWYPNDGRGVFDTQRAITNNAAHALSVYAADLDGDGDMDILSASHFDDKIAWYPNQGGGTFPEQRIISTDAVRARGVYAADMDSDGALDVLSASANDDKIAWYRNEGEGIFSAEQVVTTEAIGASSVHAADLDRDGDPDVLSASFESGQIAWYENRQSVLAVPPDAVVSLVPRADDVVRQGFVRVINRDRRAGVIRVDAYDDEGNHHGPLSLAIAGSATVHFNSDDLEAGNPRKGLATGTGSGEGDWRLELRTDLDIELLAYIRTADGFLTAMHDAAPGTGSRHWIAIFNPGRNVNQVSSLRLVNAADDDATVGVTARDDDGGSAFTRLMVPAGKTRTLTAQDLESGSGGLSRGIGRGQGKWGLTIESSGPITAMSLLESPTGHLTNLSSVPVPGSVHVVPLFPARSAGGRQGFVRVVNRSGRTGQADIAAFDDDGRERRLTLNLPADGAVHFNSNDLEFGNTGKGLRGSTGPGTGDWRLEVTSALVIDVLAYVRTADGFLTAMHDTAPLIDVRRHVAVFNPGANRNQVSSLRLANPTGRMAMASIRGIDDSGVSGGVVRVSIPAGGARTFTAQQLESGSGLSGALGDGAGKWRLEVGSNEQILVMSLLESPTGHLTNLSSAPWSPPDASTSIYRALVSGQVVQSKCLNCHVVDGVAANTRLNFVPDTIVNYQARNLQVLRDFVTRNDDGANLMLAKIRGLEGHGGGVQVAAGSPDYGNMERLLGLLGRTEPAEVTYSLTLNVTDIKAEGAVSGAAISVEGSNAVIGPTLTVRQ